MPQGLADELAPPVIEKRAPPDLLMSTLSSVHLRSVPLRRYCRRLDPTEHLRLHVSPE